MVQFTILIPYLFLTLFVNFSSLQASEEYNYFHENEIKELVYQNGMRIKSENTIWLKAQHQSEQNYEKLKQNIGWVYYPESRIKHSITALDQNPNTAFYYLNSLSHRNTPSYHQKYNRHFIIAGDSNVFGVGVQQNETIAALFEQKNPFTKGYNLGHIGGGPHNTLGLMKKYNWSKDINENQGEMYYLHFPEWMTQRTIGSKLYIAWDKGLSPWFYLNSKNDLVLGGNFNKRRTTILFKILTFLDIFNLIGDMPHVEKQHFFLEAKIFKEMEKSYLNKFPNGVFTVLISEYRLSDLRWTTYLGEFLKKEKVKFRIINKKQQHIIEDLHLPDLHFNSKGQAYLLNSLFP